MAYSKQMQDGNLYSYYFAPRGNRRMADLGMQLSQMYLSPFDHIIGIIGDAGAGKSLLIKGMFPGVDLTNDDEGVNIRPLPLLHENLEDPFSPHTYHLDRFKLCHIPCMRLALQTLQSQSSAPRPCIYG